MAKITVTAVSFVAVAFAVWIGAALRESRYQLQALRYGDRVLDRLAEAARQTSAAIAGGVVSGVLVAGFGGRLLMRIVAATSDELAQGRRTDAGEIVGQVNIEGTIFLVLYVGLFAGMFGALALLLFRRFLPSRSWIAGLVVAGAIGGPMARPVDLLNPESIDFKIFGPRWLAASLGVALIGVLGVVGAELIDTFTGRWPAPSRSASGVAGLVPLLLLGLLGPGLLVVLPVLIVRAFVRADRFVGKTSTAMKVISTILVGAGVVGWLWILASAVVIAV